MTPVQLDAVVVEVQNRLIAAGLCAGDVTRYRDTPTQEDDLPTADVFLGDDIGTPDGDPRTGHVRMIHDTKIGVEIRVAANDGISHRGALKTEAMKVYQAILPHFFEIAPKAEGLKGVSLVCVTVPEAGRVEGRALILFEILHRQSWEPPTDTLPAFGRATVTTPGGITSTITPPQP